MDIRAIAWSGLWCLLGLALLLHVWRGSRLNTVGRLIWSAILVIALGVGWGGVPLAERAVTDPPSRPVATTRTVTHYLPGVARIAAVDTDLEGRRVGATTTVRILLPVIFLIGAALYAALVPSRASGDD